LALRDNAPAARTTTRSYLQAPAALRCCHSARRRDVHAH